MIFINRHKLTGLALLTLAGCSLAPEVQEARTQEHTSAKVELSTKELYKQTLLASPNAYLSTAEVVPDSLAASFKQALAFKNSKQLDTAKQLLLSLRDQYPGFSGIELQLGDLAMAQQDESAAIKHYQAAVSANKYNYYAHNRLGVLQRKLGRFTEAEQSYQAAISAWPGFSDAYLNLAILQDLYLNQKASALENYQTYQLLNPDGNRRVKGWIRDIDSQIAQANKG
ncbi:tetratricopeptide repeat protein [Psychromonas sp.]|uniref:tetratricopeptide repeat protein n=1 Tax=Psychromonas sp. TaxID=1884585 RepID=UPI003563D271